MADRDRRPWRSGSVVEIRTPVPGDSAHLVGVLSEQDKEELRAATGLLPGDALELALGESVESSVATVDSRPVAMWGVYLGRGWGRAWPSGLANCWLFCSPAVSVAPLAFTKIVREELVKLSRTYGVLMAFSYSESQDHHRWLERLGFVRVGPVDIPQTGKTFIQFAGRFL